MPHSYSNKRIFFAVHCENDVNCSGEKEGTEKKEKMSRGEKKYRLFITAIIADIYKKGESTPKKKNRNRLLIE